MIVPEGSKVEIGGVKGGKGLRAYLAIRGGFLGIPTYLGSKSTSMALGGYQVNHSVTFPIFKTKILP